MLPLIVSAVAALVGSYAVLKAKGNEAKKDQSTERIDLLGASQASLKEALDRADVERERADAENDRLREVMLKMRNEHEVDRIQWRAKFEAQDMELTSLRVQMRACQESLAVLSHNVAPAKDTDE